MRRRTRNGGVLTFWTARRSPLFSSLGACVLLSAVLVLSSIARGAVPKTYVFSDVRHIVDVDDYVGTEIVIRLDPESKRVAGQWDLYQGYDPLTMQLEGTLVGSRLELKGRDADLRPELTGILSEKMITGTLKWYVGQNLQTKKIRLRRVQGRLQDLRSGGAKHNP